MYDVQYNVNYICNNAHPLVYCASQKPLPVESYQLEDHSE